MTASSEYEKIVTALKQRKKGATVADICANTALPLATVKELLPKAADEYSGHLRVTQSGEILYYFPKGFKSRYRGFGAFIKKVFSKTASFTKKALALLFKIWIMVMLIGYFVFFILLTLAVFFLSIAARNNNDDRGGGFGGLRIFDFLIRLWFIGELNRPLDDYNYRPKKKKDKRPLHKGVFSFIFGDEDPNKNWNEQQSRAVIYYLQSNAGCISLAEYMSFTGENSLDAEKSLLSFCSKYGGSPEVTEEGTIVYRFDDLLLKSQNENLYAPSKLSPPIQRLKVFSENSKKMNVWLIIINSVNLLFGSYFLYQSFNAGQLITELQYQAASYFYAIVHSLLNLIMTTPHIFIGIVLGLIPFLFSMFFWLIPSIRFFLEKKENENIKLTNFKRFSFHKIWNKPSGIKTESFKINTEECCPKDLDEAGDRVIKEMGVVFNPEIEVNEEGIAVYSFNEIKKEKEALEKYRSNINLVQKQIGEIIFDSNE